MKRIHYLFGLFIITITGCDCRYNYTFIMSNASNDNVTVIYQIKQDNEIELTLEPGGSHVIYYDDGFRCGCRNCKGEPINSADSSINYFIKVSSIMKSDSIPSITDYNKEENWSFESKSSLGVYTANIKDADF